MRSVIPNPDGVCRGEESLRDPARRGLSAIGGRALRPPTLARRGWGTPRSHSWCGTESAAGEGTLRYVISSVARNLSERFLGPAENAGPRNDTEILSCIKPGVARCIILSPGFAGGLQHLAEPGSPVARLFRGGAFLLRACSSSIPSRMHSFHSCFSCALRGLVPQGRRAARHLTGKSACPTVPVRADS